MHTIEQALEVYREKLREYHRWSIETKLKYGWIPGRPADDIEFNDADWNILKMEYYAFQSMEKLLGLTTAEIKSIDEQISKEVENVSVTMVSQSVLT
jgi:hypothetical protein